MPIKNGLLIIVLLNLLTMTTAWAKCDEHFIATVQEKSTDQRIPVQRFTACKHWPPDDSLAIVVFAYQAGEDEADDFAKYDVEILLTNRTNGTIKQRFFKEGWWVSDAIQLDDVVIDTARYWVTPNERAFGIRTSYVGSSRVNPFNYSDLYLFTSQPKRLNLIVDEIEIAKFSGEVDLGCSGTYSEKKSTLHILHSKTNGYFDLKIKTLQQDIYSKNNGDECDEHYKKPIKSQYILRYQNGVYTRAN